MNKVYDEGYRIGYQNGYNDGMERTTQLIEKIVKSIRDPNEKKKD